MVPPDRAPGSPLTSPLLWAPLALIVVFFVAWAFIAPPLDPSPPGDPGTGGERSAPDALDTAIDLYENGDRDGAVARLEELRRTTPTDANVLLQLARIANLEGRSRDAERFLEAATKADPDHAEAWTAYATLLLLTERGPEAAASFEKAIAADPRYAPARFYYGQMLEDAGLLSRARPEYEWARRLDPGTPYYGLLEARLLWKMYQPILARTLLAQVEREASRPLTADEERLRATILEDLEIWPEGPPPDALPPDPEDVIDEQPDEGH